MPLNERQQDENTSTPPPVPAGVFATTHWSVVLAAGDRNSSGFSQSLEALFGSYWWPLYAFARRAGCSPSDAEDLTQGFFVRLLQKEYLQSAAREKGRFRTFLLVAFKRYMANEWDREHARKRGGFSQRMPIHTEIGETRFANEPASDATPDVLYDRNWAVTLLDLAMNKLRQEYVASGRAKLFEHLQASISAEEHSLPYAEVAARLNLTTAAVKMAVHRLRARYREILRDEIAHTLSSPAFIEDELQTLFAAFESSP